MSTERKQTLAALAEVLLAELGRAGPPVADDPAAIADDTFRLLDAVPEILRGLILAAADELGRASDGGRRFAAVPLAERATLFDRLWDTSPWRGGFAQLSRALWLVVYSRAPARDAVGFVPQQHPTMAVPLERLGDLDRTYDVCVIGSGAGGAVVAARAAEAGREVLLVDEGSWISPDALPVRDDRALIDGYRNAGLQVALPAPNAVLMPSGIATMLVLQARIFGGGPTINNAIHLPIPEERWRLWRDRHEFPIDWPELDAALRRVAADLGVTVDRAMRGIGERSDVFRVGAESLGWSVGDLPVSILGCHGCGACNLGCRFGRKTGGLHGPRPPGAPLSYLERARLAPNVFFRPAIRINRLHGGGSGTRVRLATGEDLAAGGRRVEIRAERFVLAAGPIASSKILIRSGIGIPDYPTGTKISANVVLPVLALLAESVGAGDGAAKPDPGLQMCWFVDRDGALLESWFHFPGSLALALAHRPSAHAALLRQYGRLAACGVVVASGPSGSLGLTWDPVFTPSRDEIERLVRGVENVATAYFAAGATEVIPAAARPVTIRRASEAADRQAFRDSVRGPADLMLATAHPQGGNAIGRRRGRSVVNPDFRPHDIKGLHVADASLFPDGCGVNPQMTVMALAHLAADRLLAG